MDLPAGAACLLRGQGGFVNLIRRTASLLGCTLALLAGPLTITSAIAGSVALRWTSPGDDSTVGRATRYDMRYSLQRITALDYAQATVVAGVPAPKVAGSPETFTVPGLVAGAGYYFAIKAVDDAGNTSSISNVVFRIGQGAVGADPSGFTLSFSAPYPNPARQTARCNFALAEAGSIEVEAFDITGRHIRTIGSGTRPAGRGEVTWDLNDDSGRSVAAGIYLVRARIAGQIWTKRLVVSR